MRSSINTLIVLTAVLSGCAGLEVVPPGREVMPISSQGTQNLPARFQSYDSLHFRFRGEDYGSLTRLAAQAEEIYRKIMFDTSLLSFKPRENYLIVLYRDAMDYHLNTGYPLWSGGGAVTQPLGQVLPADRETKARTSIYTWEANATPALLAHEISHLVFNEFMAFETAFDADNARWINEGLATYEELSAYSEEDRSAYVRATHDILRKDAMPIASVTDYRPLSAAVKTLGSFLYNGGTYSYSNIDVWYWQVRSLTQFLIEGHGRYGFYQLMVAVRERKDWVTALNRAYPGKWKSLEDLETEWKQWLQK